MDIMSLGSTIEDSISKGYSKDYVNSLPDSGKESTGVRRLNLLGHSNVSTTMNVYAHATREAKRESAKLLDKVVGMN